MKIIALSFGLIFTLATHAQSPLEPAPRGQAKLPPGHPAVHGAMPGVPASNAGAKPAAPLLVPELALRAFKEKAAGIDVQTIRQLPTQNNGRLKPLDTFARETALFITGKYSPFGLDAVQFLLGLMLVDQGENLEVIEVRDADLRKQLRLAADRRLYSALELDQSTLPLLAQPLMQRAETDSNSLSEKEKKIMEVLHQVQLVKMISTGEYFLRAIDIAALSGDGSNQNDIQALAQRYLGALAQGQTTEASTLATQLVYQASRQKVPELFQRSLDHMKLEVFFNHFRFFFWAALLYCLLAFFFVSPFAKKLLNPKLAPLLFIAPMALHITGFAMRVVITGFAPVTNMYGTMIWVGFGIVLFSQVLLVLYSNYFIVGLLAAGAGFVLLLTESIPLILSPDLDPIVAVLRSNYWLTIHVLTITISYAALTIAMLIGNAALIRTIFSKENGAFFKEYAHYAYRMIQLGVFLLTVGIILGGIWADYSWGRFWGWDPKETWALIADVGFIALLHARYIGWIRDFGILAFSPVAYLLVIMAWYGVNFILAAGLHSYGFSSGGAMMVTSFVTAQLLLFGAAAAKVWSQRQKG